MARHVPLTGIARLAPRLFAREQLGKDMRPVAVARHALVALPTMPGAPIRAVEADMRTRVLNPRTRRTRCAPPRHPLRTDVGQPAAFLTRECPTRSERGALATSSMGLSGVGRELVHGSVNLLFSCMDLVDRALTTLLRGSSAAAAQHDTHPPALTRRRAALQHSHRGAVKGGCQGCSQRGQVL
jgi:hypothetical protein